ncbi:hypothetical protein AVL50_00185 [Flammeovirga sp. SJP92]|nr:hypothetical protein AVL50_00185 [Flammeovirga sp. SJP92]
MACDLINDEEDCSTASVLRHYNTLISDISRADTTDCQAIAEALDSAIVFVEDNKICVVTSFASADSTIDALSFIDNELEKWKTTRAQYDECAGFTTSVAPCSAEMIASKRDEYKIAYYDAYDSRNCDDILAAIDTYVSYMEENKDCIAESSSIAAVDTEIEVFISARKIILESSCHADVLETFNLFGQITEVSEMSCVQAASTFVKAESLYQDALLEQNCHSLILNAERIIEIYDNKLDCLVEFVADKYEFTEDEAREIITQKIGIINQNLESAKSNCSGFDE